MENQNGVIEAPLPGEADLGVPGRVEPVETVSVLETLGRRVRVEWDAAAPVSPMGQLVYFAQFLATAGLFAEWVKGCPLDYTSPNAPSKQDVLGTWTLGILAGHYRYAHLTALRGDQVNPQGLGMKQVCSEDSVRLAFKEADPAACAQWQHNALAQCWEPVLKHPWIMDIDMSVKPIYGHQEGAQVGYNPHKPGRPSHTLHTYFVRGLRLVLDVEVRPGKEHAARHGQAALWSWWDRLPQEQRPWLVCGDCGYGQEGVMRACEERGQKYLFRQRQTRKVQQLIRDLVNRLMTRWVPTQRGWEGAEGRLRLHGWTEQRRVIVLRRARQAAPSDTALLSEQTPALPGTELVESLPHYDYLVLVTNLPQELLSVSHLYLQRADAENVYDELKNQWGWGGFMTRDLHRCQVAARTVALIYNWWSLFVRCAQPERPREAITSRPLLLYGIGRLSESGHQLKVQLTSVHEEAGRVQRLLTGLSQFLNGLRNTAEQLSPRQCWERIWQRILAPFWVPAATLPGPSG